LSYISNVLPETNFGKFLREINLKQFEEQLNEDHDDDCNNGNAKILSKCRMKLIAIFKFYRSAHSFETSSYNNPSIPTLATHHIKQAFRGSMCLLIVNYCNLIGKEKEQKVGRFLEQVLRKFKDEPSEILSSEDMKYVTFDFYDFKNDTSELGLDYESILKVYKEFIKSL
jgi:hypothetical protein